MIFFKQVSLSGGQNIKWLLSHIASNQHLKTWERRHGYIAPASYI